MDKIPRRKLLVRAGTALAGLGLADAERAEARSTTAVSKHASLKVIVAGGHPGDPEYGCGGLIARYCASGADVALLYLNRGEGGIPGKSAAEAAAIRSTEAVTACNLLKARPLFAGQLDGASIVDNAHYDNFTRIIQVEKPDVLFTQWPIDNHPDHRATSILCYEAWLRMHKKFGFYYYEVSTGEDTQMFAPTEYVDITAVEVVKRAACYAHASQSPDRFYALQSQVARFRGVESGYRAAEAFVRHVKSPGGLLPGASAKG